MKIIVALMVGLVLFAGCESLKQANEDRVVGMTAPLEEGEIHPNEQAKNWVSAFSSLPYVGPFVPLALPVFAAFFGWKRGAKKRKALAPSMKPITGAAGKALGLESVVQHLTNVVTGLTEVGPDGSGLKRGWKVGLSTAGSLVLASLAFPQVQELLLANPEVGVALTALAGGLAALEKEMSKILPVTPQV